MAIALEEEPDIVAHSAPGLRAMSGRASGNASSRKRAFLVFLASLREVDLNSRRGEQIT